MDPLDLPNLTNTQIVRLACLELAVKALKDDRPGGTAETATSIASKFESYVQDRSRPHGS